ncbi:MAG TPA: hypothetical protein DCR74_08440, partial [Achromobacter sp.]|nr:hypothetical protein [Achromobacter sp.]
MSTPDKTRAAGSRGTGSSGAGGSDAGRPYAGGPHAGGPDTNHRLTAWVVAVLLAVGLGWGGWRL